MTITINGKNVSKDRLDQWKQKRIPKVLRTLKREMLLSGSAEEANALLAEIKLSYSYDEIYSLLKPKLFIGDLMMKWMAALSGNKRRFALTEIQIDGMTAAEMIKQLDRLMLEPSKENDAVNLSACPDHYILRPVGGNMLEVIETCGSSPVPVQFMITYGDETGLHTPRNNTYPYQSAGVARLKDGQLIGGVRHQFKDTKTGLEAKLLVEFPVLTPGYIIRAHQMHLACEFSYWFQWIKSHKTKAV